MSCVKRAFDEELAGVLVEGYRGATTPSTDWLEGLSVGRGGLKVARSLCVMMAREVRHVDGGARAKLAALYTRCVCWTMQLVGVPVDWSRVGAGAALLKLVTDLDDIIDTAPVEARDRLIDEHMDVVRGYGGVVGDLLGEVVRAERGILVSETEEVVVLRARSCYFLTISVALCMCKAGEPVDGLVEIGWTGVVWGLLDDLLDLREDLDAGTRSPATHSPKRTLCTVLRLVQELRDRRRSVLVDVIAAYVSVMLHDIDVRWSRDTPAGVGGVLEAARGVAYPVPSQGDVGVLEDCVAALSK